MDLAYAVRLIATLLWTAFACSSLRREGGRGQLIAGTAIFGALAVICQALTGSDWDSALGAGATVIGPSVVVALMTKRTAQTKRQEPKPRTTWSLRFSWDLTRNPARPAPRPQDGSK